MCPKARHLFAFVSTSAVTGLVFMLRFRLFLAHSAVSNTKEHYCIRVNYNDQGYLPCRLFLSCCLLSFFVTGEAPQMFTVRQVLSHAGRP